MKNFICTTSTLSLTVAVFILSVMSATAQNVAITDDNSYTAHTSAMLDVKSTTKGFLAPRVTTAQRNAIASPATGLLVFDTSLGRYYYYGGSQWIDLSSGSASGPYWSYSSPNIYMTTSTNYLGLGTSSPLHKLHLLQNVATTDGTDGNFIDIQNTSGSYGVMSGIRFWNGTTANTFKGAIFYQDRLSYGRGDLILANRTLDDQTDVSAGDARMIIKSEGNVEVRATADAAANKAIFNVCNADGDTVFAVYPQGVRVYVADDPALKAPGSRSGFAVGGFSLSKGITNEFLRVTPDSVRVYIEEDAAKAGAKGGFAVGGFSLSKADPWNLLSVTDARTKVWVGDSTQGFAVNNIQTGSEQNLMNLTTQNYFIGHESGVNNTTGTYNTFLGYEAGRSNTGGENGVFLGYKAGRSNTGGDQNVFIGMKAGLLNASGNQNIMIGTQAGEANTGGSFNVYIGTRAGWKSNPASGGNTFVGNQAGGQCPTATLSTYLGWNAGSMADGDNNTYLGTFTGWDNSDGNNNVCIGAWAGGNYGSSNVIIGYSAETTGDGNVVIGNSASVSGSNKLAIDNSSTSSPLVYGDFSSDQLTVNGDLLVTDTYFRITTDPGSGATPVSYCYQGGSTGSASRQYAFTVNDALWVTSDAFFDGSIHIGDNGTEIDEVQAGTSNIGANSSGGVKTVTVTFPSTFTSTPKINVTVRGGNYSDTFAVTTRNISTTSFQVNIYRVDSPGGIWAQSLQIDWFAWKQ
ncbi:MAG: H-type lectin domain-containing protein [Bacteroidetes bacterium]|nr:H-type lectin domain-containing protein [Bacteroidota bacterium]